MGQFIQQHATRDGAPEAAPLGTHAHSSAASLAAAASVNGGPAGFAGETQDLGSDRQRGDTGQALADDVQVALHGADEQPFLEVRCRGLCSCPRCARWRWHPARASSSLRVAVARLRLAEFAVLWCPRHGGRRHGVSAAEHWIWRATSARQQAQTWGVLLLLLPSQCCFTVLGRIRRRVLGMGLGNMRLRRAVEDELDCGWCRTQDCESKVLDIVCSLCADDSSRCLCLCVPCLCAPVSLCLRVSVPLCFCASVSCRVRSGYARRAACGSDGHRCIRARAWPFKSGAALWWCSRGQGGAGRGRQSVGKGREALSVGKGREALSDGSSRGG